MTQAIQAILAAQDEGRINEADAMTALDGQEVRGAFRTDGSYIGYDYRNQIWIDSRD